MDRFAIWESVSAKTTNILSTKALGNMVCSLPKVIESQVNLKCWLKSLKMLIQALFEGETGTK